MEQDCLQALSLYYFEGQCQSNETYIVDKHEVGA